jgi:hypothetical protein
LQPGDASGATPTPLSPPQGGLCLWCGGDGSIITSADDPGDEARMIGWTNLVFPINGHLFAAQSGFGDGPYTGIDSLDGKPSLTWRTDRDNTQNCNLDTIPASGVPTSMKATSGDDFGYALGEHQARSFVAVIRPRYFAGFTGGEAHIGGTVAAWGSSPNWVPLFDSESNFDPDAFYAVSTQLDWRAHATTPYVLRGPDTPDGPGGTYDDVPLVVEWSTTGGTDMSFYINGVAVPLLPAVLDPGAIVGGLSWLLGNQSPPNRVSRYYGTMTEIFVYDFKLVENEGARTQLYAYLASRYPSIPLTVP